MTIFKRYILFYVIIGLVFVSASYAQSTATIEGIIIEADAKYIDETEFIAKITKAINLLKSKSPEDLDRIKSVTRKIRATAASSANFNEPVMTIDIAKQTFEASLEWLASALVHENEHLKKYIDTGKKYGNAYLITDKKAALQVMINEELDCNKVQLRALERVGGQKSEIDYLKDQKGDHFDVDKDGDFDMDDYKKRNW